MKNDKQNIKQDDSQKQEKIKEKNDISEEEISALKSLIEESENKYKRALADYQNLEKRVRDERANWIQSANKDLLLRILPVLDTLILASKHSEDKTLQVSIQQFLDVLKNEGVERIKTEKQEFEAQTMECIGTQEGDKGKVLEETRTGYKMGDTVLRPAQVIVGEKGDSETGSE